MNKIAIILMMSMGFLWLNRFTVATNWKAANTEQSCSMTCCSDGACCCGDSEDESDIGAGTEKDTQCTEGCDCSYSIQIVATGVHFQSSLELELQAIDYGSYGDLYHYDYLPPHFQPPRLV